MKYEKAFWKCLKYCVLAVSFSVAVCAQQTSFPYKPDAGLSQAIGNAVLQAAERYQQKTGKPASTIVIHLTGKPPSPEAGTPLTPGLNQYHYRFTVEVQSAPGNSKTK